MNRPKNLSADEIRASGETAIKRPGKYQGEKRYVPYLHEQSIYCGLESVGDVSTFGLNIVEVDLVPGDSEIFPELAGRSTIYLMEDNFGFVAEIDKARFDQISADYYKFCDEEEDEE